MRLLSLLATALLAAAGAAARADQIETLAGDFEEDLAAIVREGETLTLVTTKRRVPCADVKEVRFAAAARDPRPAMARVFLVNGDELAGEIAGGDDAKIALRSGSLGAVEVKLEAVKDVVFSGDERDAREFRRQAAKREAKSDVVITRSLSRSEGVLERIDERGVSIDAKGIGKVTLSPEKVLGVRVAALGKPPVRPAGLFARLDLADGGILTGRLESYKDGVFKIHSFRPGVEVKRDEVRVLSFGGGRIVYLSDLTPVEVKETPGDSVLARPYQRDQSAIGPPFEGALRLDGRKFRRGLGVKASSRLVFDLGGKFTKFRARIGLDDFVREQPPVPGELVWFQVIVDGKNALSGEGGRGEGRSSSPADERGIAFAQGDPSRPIEVDVTGAKSLALVCGFGKYEVVLPFGDWADAVLVKNP